MRQLFRKEYAKELEDTETALTAESVSVLTTQPLVALRAKSEPTAPSVQIEVDTQPTPSQPEKRGFWSSLFKKRE